MRCISELLRHLSYGVVARHLERLPPYPTVRAEFGEAHDVVLVWSEKVPATFEFMVAQHVYASFIGHKMTAALLNKVASHAMSLVMRYFNAGYIWRFGTVWEYSGDKLGLEIPWELKIGEFRCTR